MLAVKSYAMSSPGQLDPLCGLGLEAKNLCLVQFGLKSSFVCQYAMLAPLLERVLCVSASSAPVERVISKSGLIGPNLIKESPHE